MAGDVEEEAILVPLLPDEALLTHSVIKKVVDHLHGWIKLVKQDRCRGDRQDR